jgi:hypothetical protein
MRDMNADRASMMKNRPLRNREDKDRVREGVVFNAAATLSASFAMQETRVEPGFRVSLPRNSSASISAAPATADVKLKDVP